MKRLGLVAACTVLVVPITAAPAHAVTGTWVDRVLTLVASPGDGDVRFEVYADCTDSCIVSVRTTPDAAVSGCDHLTGPNGAYSYCHGDPKKIVLDGGVGRADIVVSAEGEPAADITAGAAGGSVDATVGSATVTGRSGRDVVTAWSTTLHAELRAGDDSLAWTAQGGNALVMLGVGDDAFLVSPAPEAMSTASVVVQGGGGADDLTAAGRAMRAYGGPGDDRFQPDATYYDWYQDVEVSPVMKGDVIDGGPGVDTVLLGSPGHARSLRVTLDGRADDGIPGEKDNYGADVENVVVRFVRAVVVGNRRDNRLELLAGGTSYGGRGSDILVGGSRQFGGPGHDVFLGGAGTMTVHAVDGVRDDVRCESHRTIVYADRVDLVSASCRHVVRR